MTQAEPGCGAAAATPVDSPRSHLHDRSPPMQPLVRKMDSTPELLQPFVKQSFPVRSIVAFGFGPPLEFAGADTPDAARALAGAAPDTDLLLVPPDCLREMLASSAAAFRFRAVAVLWPRATEDQGGGEPWKLQRSLFDRGLVAIGTAHVADGTAHCFLASDAIRAADRLGGAARGRVSFATLGHNVRFANQLFQYAYAKLYALRHGLTAAIPDWEGRQLFGLDDPSCDGPMLPTLAFAGFSDEDLQLWDWEAPPIDVDLKGYFQETPACWKPHRPLLRQLFQPAVAGRQAIDAWHHRVTDAGQRTLVAIHVRRGDYRRLALDLPWFRLVPEAWYLDWLRALWPTLRNPLLFVATDEPDAIRPLFREFETVAAAFGAPADALPEHVRDFEVLRRADCLALCNSSYSRMAAMLAPSTQKCFAPSFQEARFLPYEPWIDPAFWDRFAGSRRSMALAGDAHREPGETLADGAAPAPREVPVTILFDVSDLVLYLIDHATLSGIQRVHCELLRNLLDIPHPGSIRLVVLNHGDEFGAIDTPAFLAILGAVGSGSGTRAAVVSALRGLLGRAVACHAWPRDVFLTVGAFWAVHGMGRLLQQLKAAGVIVGTLIHDVLPIEAPEYFEVGMTRRFVKGVVEILTFADFIFTTSEYNRAALSRVMDARGFARVPVRVLPLAREHAHAAPVEAAVSQRVQDILDADYVLCVGTIEVRKNPAYLLHVWKLMVQAGRPDIPTLVFAGRSGWLVRDFLDQLAACDYLGGRIAIVHTATDVELDLLYRHCLLTMFPSFAEGWGLPVGESLAHGKICLCSATGGIPEAGGVAADYIDPYNARDGLAQLTRYLDAPGLRHRREREIAAQFAARSWRSVAGDFLGATRTLAREVPAVDGTPAIRLPAGQFLPITRAVTEIPLDAIGGALSAELACISGWHPPESIGVRAAGPDAVLRFRADAPAGAGIVLVLRLATRGHAFRVRIRSGSGAETEVPLAAGRESVASLSCLVEAGSIVTAQLSAAGTVGAEREPLVARDWVLKGMLYFEPRRLTAASALQMQRGQPMPSSGAAPSLPRAERPVRTKSGARPAHVPLPPSATMDESRRAASFGEFLRAPDSWWPTGGVSRLDVPLFADDADRRAFVAGCATGPHAAGVGKDGIRLTRRSDVYVSMARFSEGSVFDRSGVWRALGYLQGAPRGSAPWLSEAEDGLGLDARALAAAPFLDASCLVFYNGNLQNYYHWLAEGLLGLDILTEAMGPDADVQIALPRSMDIAAAFDHRPSLGAVGLDGPRVFEVAADLVRVREAIWIDSDLVQTMPATYLRRFQQRVATRYAGRRGPRGKRLLVARKGPTRTIANLGEVQAALSGYGFETVHLEGMSMAEQILLFQSAAFIVGPHGAGLANLLFCEPGTRVVELMPDAEFRPFFWLISAKLELVHGLQFCRTTEGEGFQGALRVDVAKLSRLVRAVDAGT